jgi:hypothetical protein
MITLVYGAVIIQNTPLKLPQTNESKALRFFCISRTKKACKAPSYGFFMEYYFI